MLGGVLQATLSVLYPSLNNSLYNLPLMGSVSGTTGVNDLPVAGQSRGVTEPQRDRGTVAKRRWMRCKCRRKNVKGEYMEILKA